ncbi:MAG: PqqD family protein [Candidatus Brocadiaceae bacterium]|nr:PqqD family protein [Candidatus Brocadiaceae bacterium]
MRPFGRPRSAGRPLSRALSLSARPVLNRLVKVDRDREGHVILQVPRADNSLVRSVTRWFRLPPYKPIALDELGTFVIELCDGRRTVRDLVDMFAKRYKLNRREAEVGMTTFLRTLARRSIIALVIEGEDVPAP